MGFPWSLNSVNRSLSSVGGTVAATHAVCEGRTQFAAHIAGGTHHAFADHGEGFSTFSDIAVAALVALRDYPRTMHRVLIVDLDVHQGNGNAVLFQEDERVFTFSMHCEANYFSKACARFACGLRQGRSSGSHRSSEAEGELQGASISRCAAAAGARAARAKAAAVAVCAA